MIVELEYRRTELESLCQNFGVRRLDVFGSAAGERFSNERSDLDFLVEFESPKSPGYADRYFGLLGSLERLFRRRVDLVVSDAVKNPYLWESIEKTRTALYAP